MYNLTVEGAHTFYVGDGQWLVHNAGCFGVEEILKNPYLLTEDSATNPQEVQRIVDMARKLGWRVEALGRGAHEGQGYALWQLMPNGKASGRTIFWHPGGGHHGSSPYWKISRREGGTVRIGPALP